MPGPPSSTNKPQGFLGVNNLMLDIGTHFHQWSAIIGDDSSPADIIGMAKCITGPKQTRTLLGRGNTISEYIRWAKDCAKKQVEITQQRCFAYLTFLTICGAAATAPKSFLSAGTLTIYLWQLTPFEGIPRSSLLSGATE